MDKGLYPQISHGTKFVGKNGWVMFTTDYPRIFTTEYPRTKVTHGFATDLLPTDYPRDFTHGFYPQILPTDLPQTFYPQIYHWYFHPHITHGTHFFYKKKLNLQKNPDFVINQKI